MLICMNTIKFMFVALCFIAWHNTQAQSKLNGIPVSQLPSEVKSVLEEYVKILSSSKDLDECAQKFTSIAGGGLINEDPQQRYFERERKTLLS